jgi:hypothetical protein
MFDNYEKSWYSISTHKKAFTHLPVMKSMYENDYGAEYVYHSTGGYMPQNQEAE